MKAGFSHLANEPTVFTFGKFPLGRFNIQTNKKQGLSISHNWILPNNFSDRGEGTQRH